MKGNVWAKFLQIQIGGNAVIEAYNPLGTAVR